ncbi:MAG: YdjY domain-containing protein [Planctomycetia bacterium]|nr:YdjY domain-containing protein [Planctomycetia bacterium]
MKKLFFFFLLSFSFLFPLTGEETKSFNPLADHPETLKQLDKTEPIWVSPDRKQLILGGTVCLREGLLEFFACREKSKEHESIVSLPIKPHLIHAGLLIIGAKPGSPARFDPVFVPAKGEKIAIHIRWLDSGGVQKEINAKEWIRESKTQKTMSDSWVFTGGLFGTDSKGKKYYLADLSGEIFGVANFPGSVLDVPFESTADNDNLFYQPNTEKIPPEGTPITLILTREAL